MDETGSRDWTEEKPEDGLLILAVVSLIVGARPCRRGVPGFARCGRPSARQPDRLVAWCARARVSAGGRRLRLSNGRRRMAGQALLAGGLGQWNSSCRGGLARSGSPRPRRARSRQVRRRSLGDRRGPGPRPRRTDRADGREHRRSDRAGPSSPPVRFSRAVGRRRGRGPSSLSDWVFRWRGGSRFLTRRDGGMALREFELRPRMRF